VDGGLAEIDGGDPLLPMRPPVYVTEDVLKFAGAVAG
jgi:hypothetical protein